jgi:hypothetical protein
VNPVSRFLPLTVMLLAGVASAAPVRAGVDVALLLRQEAGGQRSGLVSGGPRLVLDLGRYFALSADYRFAWASEGTVASATTQYHRASLRPEFHLPVRSTDFVLAAGPALTLIHTTLGGSGTPVSTSYTRLGVSGGAAVDIHLAPLTLRTGVDLVWAARRMDVSVGLGALFSFGGTP